MSATPPPPPPAPEPVPEVQPALARDVSFAVTPYRPEGGFSPLGLVLLLVGLSIAGILLGVATYFVSKLIYLILVFPLFIGIGLGAVGAFLVKAGKVRTPWLAGVAGLLAGILAMTTQHYLTYRSFMAEIDPVRQEIKDNLNQIPPAERAQIQRIIAVDSFPSFIDYQAHEGVSINRARGGNNDKGINLGYIGTYIYWGIETLIVAGIVLVATRKTALEPFCSVTNEWKTPRCGDNFMVPMELGIQPVAEALKEGALGKVAEVQAHGANSPQGTMPVRLYVYASPQHNDQCTLDAKLVQIVPAKNDQTEEKEVAMVTYPAHALLSLEALCGVVS